MPDFEFLTKNAFFCILGQNFFEKLLLHLKSALSNLPHTKILRKNKTPKLGTIYILYWVFWAEILKKLFSYLKSAPSNM